MSTDVRETKAALSGAAPEAPGFHPRRFWSWRPASDRQAGDAVVSNFLLHWFPAKAHRASLAWSYSFWLGTASAALLFLLILSGMPLLFLYVPSVERAYASVKDIEYVVTFGSWIRSVHRLSAHLMVAAVFLHLVRVFLTGAYKNGTGQGQMREWREIAAGPDASLLRNPGRDARVQQRHQRLRQLGSHPAGGPEQHIGAEQHHRPHHVGRARHEVGRDL